MRAIKSVANAAHRGQEKIHSVNQIPGDNSDAATVDLTHSPAEERPPPLLDSRYLPILFLTIAPYSSYNVRTFFDIVCRVMKCIRAINGVPGNTRAGQVVYTQNTLLCFAARAEICVPPTGAE
jgi:hypothetical protein